MLLYYLNYFPVSVKGHSCQSGKGVTIPSIHVHKIKSRVSLQLYTEFRNQIIDFDQYRDKFETGFLIV